MFFAELLRKCGSFLVTVFIASLVFPFLGMVTGTGRGFGDGVVKFLLLCGVLYVAISLTVQHGLNPTRFMERWCRIRVSPDIWSRGSRFLLVVPMVVVAALGMFGFASATGIAFLVATAAWIIVSIAAFGGVWAINNIQAFFSEETPETVEAEARTVARNVWNVASWVLIVGIVTAKAGRGLPFDDATLLYSLLIFLGVATVGWKLELGRVPEWIHRGAAIVVGGYASWLLLDRLGAVGYARAHWWVTVAAMGVVLYVGIPWLVWLMGATEETRDKNAIAEGSLWFARRAFLIAGVMLVFDLFITSAVINTIATSNAMLLLDGIPGGWQGLVRLAAVALVGVTALVIFSKRTLNVELGGLAFALLVLGLGSAAFLIAEFYYLQPAYAALPPLGGGVPPIPKARTDQWIVTVQGLITGRSLWELGYISVAGLISVLSVVDVVRTRSAKTVAGLFVTVGIFALIYYYVWGGGDFVGTVIKLMGKA